MRKKITHTNTERERYKGKKGQDTKWQLCRISTIINCLLLVVVIVNTFNKIYIYMNIEKLYVLIGLNSRQGVPINTKPKPLNTDKEFDVKIAR